MFVNDMLRSLIHRWYIVLVGLMATAGLVYGAYVVTPVSYTAQSTVVLLPPEKSVEDGDNPYLYLGGLGQALNVLVITMNSAETQETMTDDRPGLGYALEQDTTTTGPIINITTVAPEAAEAMDLLEKVQQQVPETLVDLQDELEVEGKAQIGIMTLAKATSAEEENKRQLQVMVVAAGGGSVGTLLLAAAVDKLLLRRKAKKAGGKDKDKNKKTPLGKGGSGGKRSTEDSSPAAEISEATTDPEAEATAVQGSTVSIPARTPELLPMKRLKTFNGF